MLQLRISLRVSFAETENMRPDYLMKPRIIIEGISEMISFYLIIAKSNFQPVSIHTFGYFDAKLFHSVS